MIEGLLSVLGSSFAGSAIGGLFGWLNRREDNKTKARDQDHEFRMVSANANANQQTSEARAFEESQKTKSALGDVIKSAVRPLITGLLMFMVYRIVVNLETLTGGLESLPEDMTLQLYREIILNLISLTATAINWWFASRPTGVKK